MYIIVKKYLRSYLNTDILTKVKQVKKSYSIYFSIELGNFLFAIWVTLQDQNNFNKKFAGIIFFKNVI